MIEYEGNLKILLLRHWLHHFPVYIRNQIQQKLPATSYVRSCSAEYTAGFLEYQIYRVCLEFTVLLL